MINKEKYKRELVRIWDTLRDDKYKGIESCSGVNDCDECPLYNIKCGESFNAFEFIEAIEKWSKERPQKHKVSKWEDEKPTLIQDVLRNCEVVDDDTDKRQK